MDVLEISEKLFAGELEAPGSLSPAGLGGGSENPMTPRMSITELGDGTAFVSSFANVSAFATEAGLVCVDTGSPFTASHVHEQVRTWSSDRLDTAVYSHGHIDHVFGVGVFEEEARERGWRPPQVVAHEALPHRFDRYILTAGYNGHINRRQFSADFEWPTEYRYPDETYRDRLGVQVGGERFELHHARGETDDHTWTWVPERRTLCTGDLVMWCTPNAGNPQKVQRFAREWAVALREMAELDAELLLPGHGLPVVGPERIRMLLGDTAELLEYLHDETVSLMNAGASLNEILHTVEAPAHLLEKPYLRPIYDDPEYVVRNVWRLYGGWFDLDPAHLKPARDADLASEVAALAGGASALARRAMALLSGDAGPTDRDLRVAGHLVEFAASAAPDDREVHEARARLYETRTEAEPALMTKGVFGAAARESRQRVAGAEEDERGSAGRS